MKTALDITYPCEECKHSSECDKDFGKHTNPKLTESPPPKWGVVPCAPDRLSSCDTCASKYLEGCGGSAHDYRL